jgi:hypothetical protein
MLGTRACLEVAARPSGRDRRFRAGDCIFPVPGAYAIFVLSRRQPGPGEIGPAGGRRPDRPPGSGHRELDTGSPARALRRRLGGLALISPLNLQQLVFDQREPSEEIPR